MRVLLDIALESAVVVFLRLGNISLPITDLIYFRTSFSLYLLALAYAHKSSVAVFRPPIASRVTDRGSGERILSCKEV
jgi:hypothetical protein